MDVCLAPFSTRTTVTVVPVAMTHAESNVACFARLENYGLGVVIRSEDPTFKVGDHVYGILRE